MPQAFQSWYQHDIDAWQGSAAVQEMTDSEYRAFHHLLMAQFQSEDGMLPDDDKLLAKLSRKRAEWPQIREAVLEEFESGGNGRIYNVRMHNEWKRSRDNYAKCVNASKAATEARRRKTKPANHIHADIDRSPSGDHMDSIGSAHGHPIEQNTIQHKRVEEPSARTARDEHPISGEMVAQSVMFELRISGRDLRNVLDDVCRAEIKHGELPGNVRDRMILAWQDYASPQTAAQLEYTTGAAKFFGEGRWKDRNTWPWKAGASNGTNQVNRTKAQQRSDNSDAAIFSAWSHLAGGTGAGEASAADEGELPDAGGDGRDGSFVAGGLDRAGHQARHDGVAGRTQAAPRLIEVPSVPGGHRGTHHAGAGGEAYAARC